MKPMPNDPPVGLSHVIVMGHEMDKALVVAYSTALAGAATGHEYSHRAAFIMQLAAYICSLGFQAVASMNDTALVVPLSMLMWCIH